MEHKASPPGESPQTEDLHTLTTTTTLSSSNATDGGYDYELIDGTDSRYECPICLLYLRDPVLTTCGHRFCSGCISQWVIKEGGRCPVDGVSLSHENIFPDNYTRREILQCKAKCPYAKDGCNTVLSLLDLEKHIHSHHLCIGGDMSLPGKSNGSAAVPCLYKEVGCVSYFPTDQLQRHLELDVHHHLQLLTAAYKRLKLFSSKPNLDSPFHVDHMLSRQDSREWLLAEEAGSEATDDYQFRRQRSWDSVRYARKYHNRSKYPERLAESDESVCKSADHHLRKGSKGDSSPATSDSASATTLTTYAHSETDLNIKDIFERLVCLEQNDREKQIKIERLESQLNSAVALFSTVTKLMDDLTISRNGIFVWKIPNFRQLCLEMRKNPNRVLSSPGFYTDTFGYKLCLRFNLTAPSSSSSNSALPVPRGASPNLSLEQDVDTFLSLYIHFMMGEFDDTLRWPFNGEMRLIVIHPSRPQESLLEIMNSKPEAAAFAKPTLQRNPKGFGYPEFVSINRVFSSGFVKNDTLVCKVLAKAH